MEKGKKLKDFVFKKKYGNHKTSLHILDLVQDL
jgi:hypothetical protein